MRCANVCIGLVLLVANPGWALPPVSQGGGPDAQKTEARPAVSGKAESPASHSSKEDFDPSSWKGSPEEIWPSTNPPFHFSKEKGLIPRAKTEGWQRGTVRGLHLLGDIPKGYYVQRHEKCYVYDSVVVLARGKGENVGTDIAVSRRADMNISNEVCVSRPDKLIADIPNQWAEYFMGYMDPYIFLDSGTGPERVILIHDLGKREAIYKNHYAEPISLKGESLRFYTADDKNPAVEKCPEVHGLGKGYEIEVTVDLKTMKQTATGKSRCTSRQ